MAPTPTPSDSASSHFPRLNPYDVATDLYGHLESALRDEYTRRYEDGVGLQETKEVSETSARIHIEIDYQDRPELSAELVVAASGDREFEVRCDVDSGNDCQFTVDLDPDDSWEPCARDRGEQLAHFLLGELERQLTELVFAEDGMPTDVGL